MNYFFKNELTDTNMYNTKMTSCMHGGKSVMKKINAVSSELIVCVSLPKTPRVRVGACVESLSSWNRVVS